jgi:hypothetical protein
VACSVVLSGEYTSLFDFFIFGKFMSSGTKFDVAPESITNFIVRRLSIQHVHVLLFVVAVDCFAAIMLICSGSLISSSSSLSGAQ